MWNHCQYAYGPYLKAKEWVNYLPASDPFTNHMRWTGRFQLVGLAISEHGG